MNSTEKQKTISHLYIAEVEMPVEVSFTEPDTEDYVSVQKTFYDMKSATDYIDNENFIDEIESEMDSKKDDIQDQLDVTLTKGLTTETEIKQKAVDDLNDRQIEVFLMRNPEYQLSVVQTKVFVLKQDDQKVSS